MKLSPAGSSVSEVSFMSWAAAVSGWVAWLTASGHSPATVSLRRYQLLRAAEDLRGKPGQVTAASLAKWLAAQRWARETRRSELAGLRSFFRWAVREEICARDPARDLLQLRPVEGVPRPASEEAVTSALLRADPRTRLMIELAARHGMRRGEISRIAVQDVTQAPGGWSLLVHGKGGKDRLIPLLDGTAAALRRAGEGWVFPNGDGSHLTPAHVGVLISRVLPPGVTPHMLRHRFATVVYRRTLDIRNLQKLLGHASVATTQRYAAPDDSVLRAVLASAAA